MGKNTKTGGNGKGAPWLAKDKGGAVVGCGGQHTPARTNIPVVQANNTTNPLPSSPFTPDIVINRPATPLTGRISDIDYSAGPRQPARPRVDQLHPFRRFTPSTSRRMPRTIISNPFPSFTLDMNGSDNTMNDPELVSPTPALTNLTTQHTAGRTQDATRFFSNKFQASDNMFGFSSPKSSARATHGESSQGQAGGQAFNQAAGQASNSTAGQGTTQAPPAQNAQVPPPQDGLPPEAMARAKYNNILGMYQPHASWHTIPNVDDKYLSRETLANRIRYLFDFMATPAGGRAFSERIGFNARSMRASIANTNRHIEFCQKQLNILDGIPVDMSSVVPPNGALNIAAGRDAITNKLTVDQWWLNVFTMELHLSEVAEARVIVARRATAQLADIFEGIQLTPKALADLCELYNRFQTLRDEAANTFAGIIALVGEGRACAELVARHRNELWDVWLGASTPEGARNNAQDPKAQAA